MSQPDPSQVQDISVLAREVTILRIAQACFRHIGNILDEAEVVRLLTEFIPQYVPCNYVSIYMLDDENADLVFAGCHPPASNETALEFLQSASISLYNPSLNSPLRQLAEGHLLHVTQAELGETRFQYVTRELAYPQYTLLALLFESRMIGLLLLGHDDTTQPTPLQLQILQAIGEQASVAIGNAHNHTQIVVELAHNVHEMHILQQIDAELNDTIEVSYVLQMIIDWGLRFTNANVAGLALYDQTQDILKLVNTYGHDLNELAVGESIPEEQGGITRRVAHTGQAEIIPDVSVDKDYFAVSAQTRSQLSVPILREDRVIAVLSLESFKINGFNEQHLHFALALARRAGVAVDNSRLFEETRLEREKLAHILRNIGDNVIVVGSDHRLVLINHTARQTLNLDPNADYTGKWFSSTIHPSELQELYHQAQAHDLPTVSEITLPSGRSYQVTIERLRGIGWIIVMLDVTTYKETERIKNEFIANVSHDLKQPLSSMRGFLDLLQMTNKFDERSSRYIEHLNRAFLTMRQLIDDLLDLAHIESGLSLRIEPVEIEPILRGAIELTRSKAIEKSISIALEPEETAAIVAGDPARLGQIFTNLVSNAVKYTPPGGWVNIGIRPSSDTSDTIEIFIQDSGFGISAEDIEKIFDRFYRIRNKDTQNIEGTGLGLAIVKSLIEAHNGTIKVQSRMGIGSIFTVYLPASKLEEATNLSSPATSSPETRP